MKFFLTTPFRISTFSKLHICINKSHNDIEYHLEEHYNYIFLPIQKGNSDLLIECEFFW
ncbi:hypothetical protein SAMN05421766_102703 [Zobellia uliginosa]|uniref:Uncharacterized protein n=1 Tax=Zobellia uliginosa TaxID=143224 RepID=A0ABY1KP66_9FLAO|nr:hypothetical protein SAMN05421766_102703 [Zobellia uliginosa]